MWVRNRLRLAFYVGYFDSEYTKELHAGILKFCNENDVELLTFIAGEVGDNENGMNYQNLAAASLVSDKNVDGILFATGTQLNYVGPEYILSYLKSFKPLPVVSIGYAFQSIESVLSDCSTGLKELIVHLIKEHRCQKMLFMGASVNSQEGNDREKVFRDTLKANKIAVDEKMILHGNFSYSSAYDALTEFYEKNPKKKIDAIVAANDDMAYACIDYLHAHGLRVPDDIIVTGFDDNKRSSYTIPTLSTVNQSIQQQGYAAAEVLYKILTKKKTKRLIKIPTKAVFRQSCRCLGQNEAFTEDGKKTTVKSIAISAVAEWNEKSAQLIHVVHSYSNMMSDMNMDDFRHIILAYFSDVDIPAAAIVCYKNPVSTDRFEYFPLPSEATLISAFDKTTGYDLNSNQRPISFNPNLEMIPRGVPLDVHNMVVTALFRGTVQYGYILFRANNYDMVVNTISCTMFASGLATAFNTTVAENKRKLLEEEFNVANRISVTDEMTGLLNRRGFISLGQKTLEVAEAMNQNGMVLFGDMDGLKIINDTYGHASGDRAIKAEAKLLKETFRSADIIGRLGGDEFAIVAPGMTERKFASMKKNLYANCEEWNKKSHVKFKLSISLGGTPFNSELKNYNIKALLERADESLYKEKKRKKALIKKLQKV